MRNSEIADALDELGVLYELDGAVRYRVLAYRAAAQAVRESPLSVAELARAGRVTELKGIGGTLEQKILALLDTGEIPTAAKLKRRFPPSLITVTRVPGLGAKTARRLYDELGVSSLEDLRAVAEAHRLRELRGFGPRAEENILASLERLTETPRAEGRFLLSDVLAVGEELVSVLSRSRAVERVCVAGSARRMTETCKDLDLIAAVSDRRAVAEQLRSHPLTQELGSAGPAGARLITNNGIPVELRIGEPGVFGNLLQHFTGSAAHNVALREDALKQGLSVSEHGVTVVESEEVLRFDEEAPLYERLGYAYLEPELREGQAELEAARQGTLPKLVELGDVRGDLHCHTTLSDGRNTLSEMAEAAIERGYSYLAVTDHSASHGFGNEVSAERLWRRIEEIRELDSGLDGLRLLAGSEVNVSPTGTLDYPDDLLAELDWVIASVHTAFSDEQRVMTGRVLRAIENPLVDCIGHLTGRLLTRREPYPIDAEAIVSAAAETGTMLEINGNPRRRDISERHARLAASAGARIVLTTDAHRTATLANMRYAVATARRAWLGPEQVANTRPWSRFSRLRKSHRHR